MVEIKQVASTSQIWGPRTAVWVATVEPVSQGCLLPPNGQEMRLVIKSTWIEKHLHSHELDVLQWVQDQKESLVPEPEVEPNLPLPIGFVQGETEGGIDIQDWFASDDQTRMSIIATFSVPAIPLENDIDVHTLFSIYRNLFETLDLLSRCGVHYRDLNTGNILRTIAHGPQQCVLVDFGHARILRSRRGRLEDIKRPPEPWEVNRDDYRSANEYFMCRRIHKMSLLLEHHDAYVKDYAGLKKRIEERMLTADEADVERLQGRLAKIKANIASQLEELEKASYNHRYVDDWESVIYMMLYQVSAVSRSCRLQRVD
jgi:serine/threonine protein kinase